MAAEGRCRDGGKTKGNGNCTAPGDDGLPVQCVGEWAHAEKHGYLRRYIEATQAARAKFLRAGSHGPAGGAGFLDLFAGPGRVRIRETGALEPGSPLLALETVASPFSRVVLCDADAENIAALTARAQAFASKVAIRQGDCNALIDELVALLPPTGLNLALVDPFALRALRFSTFERLARCKRLDLVINFPTQDVARNLKVVYHPADNQVLAQAIGEPNWRESIRAPNEVHLAADILVKNLARLGYTGAENRTIRVTNHQNRELYRLIFASKEPLADKIWQSVVKNPTSGQRTLGF